MEKVFRLGWIAFLVMALVRGAVTGFSKELFFDWTHSMPAEKWIYLALLAPGLLSVWHWLARNKCHRCGEGYAIHVGEEEVRTWVGHDDKGHSVTRTKIHAHYKCAYCRPEVTWYKSRVVTRR